MQVIKRDGTKEPVKFDKITARINKLCYGLDKTYVDPSIIAAKTVEGIYDGVTTEEIDTLTAEIAATLSVRHPDYSLLAGRISISNLHKKTPNTFKETVNRLYHYANPKTGFRSNIISDDLYDLANKYGDLIEEQMNYDRDFYYDYFAFKTLQRSYLLKCGQDIVERPSHMYMRVSLGIHGDDLEKAFETYNLMTSKAFTHATPTLFNSGTSHPQMSSCFLLGLKDDSMEGIFDTVKDCAMISKWSGGIGLHVSNLRATGSYISGTSGHSNGLVPMLKVFNETARYSDQGGGRRKGSFAIYLEPWHDDVFEFLDLRKNHGKEEMRARDLFLALWVPDLFMKRVEEDGDWHLFCPAESPGLQDVYGDEFDSLYNTYVQNGRFRRVVKARDLWLKILDSQIETGTPYLIYKDAVNKKSNQSNIGVIKSSNLCCEITEYSDSKEQAVCNLASISLPFFIKGKTKFDFDSLVEVSRIVTRNLNKIIDLNFYPTPETQYSNFKNRPIGIGVQGLADVYAMMNLPFDSQKAKDLNREIFASIYYGALQESIELAKEDGAYDSYIGSPASKGLLQFDLWGVEPSARYDWCKIKEDLDTYGLRNSLLLAPMPTASTSQILGNNECFEPYTTNIYTRRVLSGEFVVVNKHLVRKLIELDLWDEKMRQTLISENGSIQNIPNIPVEVKEVFKTVWEISQKDLIDMSADRGAYICQSQSLNLFISNPNTAKLTSMHFYAWKKGLKTGMYYLRTKAASEAIKFTVDKNLVENKDYNITDDLEAAQGLVCSLENPEACEMCSG